MQVSSHTSKNQAVLRQYGEKISNSFEGGQVGKEESTGLWSRLCGYLPTSKTVGSTIGDRIGTTYGAQWSNSAVQLVVGKFFPQAAQKVSLWSAEGVKRWLSGATETTLAEALKLAITPKALPYISLLTGSAGALALPAAVSLVSFVYRKAMGDPKKLAQLSQLSLDQLFTIDPETGRLRDAFGRLMSKKDMKDILTGAAKYDMICKLINLCQEIDQKDGDDDTLELESQKLLRTLVKSYKIKKEDGQVMFLDGHVLSQEEREIIRKGIGDLSRINPCHKTKNIHRLIKVLARHSMLPVETLNPSDRRIISDCSSMEPKRMPAIFPEGKDEWKNSIIRTSDGQYIVCGDFTNIKKGTRVTPEEMELIFDEMESIQHEQSMAKESTLYQTLANKENQSLVAQLNQLSSQEIKAFFQSLVIERKNDKKAVYINGDVLTEEEWQNFQKMLALLPTKREPGMRAEKLEKLVDQISGHLPAEFDLAHRFVISCQDGYNINHRGFLIDESEVSDYIRALNEIEAHLFFESFVDIPANQLEAPSDNLEVIQENLGESIAIDMTNEEPENKED